MEPTKVSTALAFSGIIQIARLIPQSPSASRDEGNPAPARAIITEAVLSFENVADFLRRDIESANRLVFEDRHEQAQVAFRDIAKRAAERYSKSHVLYIEAIFYRATSLFCLGQWWSARCLGHSACTIQAEEAKRKHYPPDMQLRLFGYLYRLTSMLEATYEHTEFLPCYLQMLRIAEDLLRQGVEVNMTEIELKLRLVSAYLVNGDKYKAMGIADSLNGDTRLSRMTIQVYKIHAIAEFNQREVSQTLIDGVMNEFANLAFEKNSLPYQNAVTTIVPCFLHLGIAKFDAYNELIAQFEKSYRWPLQKSNKPAETLNPRESLSWSSKAALFRRFNGFEPCAIILFKLRNNKLEEALGGLENLLELYSKTPDKPLMWPCRALAGAVLCRQRKYMEAEEYINSALKFHAVYFGKDSPEHLYILLLLGHTLLGRGQQERAESCLTKAWQGFKSLPSYGSTYHQMLAGRELGLCLMCGRKWKEAEEQLILVAETYNEKIVQPAKLLVSRCLGVLKAREHAWDEALSYFRAGIEQHECATASYTGVQAISAGTILGEWSMAWLEYERGDATLSIRLLNAASKHLQDAYGQDHKLTISCAHDLVIMSNEPRIVADLTSLVERAREILGAAHQLTRKIGKSLSFATNNRTVFPGETSVFWPERVYTVGNALNVNPLLADIDWISWEWKETSEAPSRTFLELPTSVEGDNSPMLAPSDHGSQGSSPWWESGHVDDEDIPRLTFTPRGKLPLPLFWGLADAYADTLLEVPRDFAPAFVERQYNRSQDVPLEWRGRLGRGGSSDFDVEEVRDLSTDQVFARKILTYAVSSKSVDYRAQIHREVNNMRKLAHPHIVKLCAAYIVPSEGKYALLIQPVAESDLQGYLADVEKEAFPTQKCHLLLSWLPCLTGALDYMHGRNIRHMDLKPGNILVKDNSVYITDFGIAKDWTQSSSTVSTGQWTAGTMMYWAPEQRTHRNRASDIFALGCVFAEIITVGELHKTLSEFHQHMREECEESQYHDCVDQSPEEFEAWFTNSDLFTALVKDMLAVEPESRPSTSELISRMSGGNLRNIGPLVCEHKPAQTDKA